MQLVIILNFMNNIFLITKREFLTQVKKKSFVILTLLAPVMIIAFGAVIGLMFKANESHNIIEVVDNSGIFAGKLKSTDQLKYVFVPVQNEKTKVNSLKDNKDVDGILILPQMTSNNFDDLEKNSRLLINTKLGFDTKQDINADISNVIKKEKIKSI